MGNVGYAMLFRTEENLELLVTSDKETLEQNLKAFKDNPSKRLIGSFKFRHPRYPTHVLEDFSAIYLGGGKVMKQAHEGIFATIKYPLDFEPTLTQAFVRYFHDHK